MKLKTDKLIEKAKESLTTSEILAQNKLYNFAGARAYYTMFYIAEAFLWTKNMSFASHSAVISAYRILRHGVKQEAIAPISRQRR